MKQKKSVGGLFLLLKLGHKNRRAIIANSELAIFMVKKCQKTMAFGSKKAAGFFVLSQSLSCLDLEF